MTNQELAALLERRRQPICEAWAEVILAEPLAHYRERSPEELQQWLGRTLGAIISALESGSQQPLVDHGRRLGERRQQLGFLIEEVVDALLCAKQAVVPFLVEELASEPQRVINGMTAFAAAMRHMVCAFTAVFADALRDRQQRVTVLEERQRVARDLHDSVSQSLYAANMYGGAVARLIDRGQVDEARGHLSELRSSTAQALREMRLLIFDLRATEPLKQGLVAALEERLAAVEGRAGIQVALRCSEPDAFPEGYHEAVFGIAREALNNAIKHAQATRIEVEIGVAEGCAYLSVRDDGTGFDVVGGCRSGGLGLKGMDERARAIGATLEVSSAPDTGTLVRVQLPSPGDQARDGE